MSNEEATIINAVRTLVRRRSSDVDEIDLDADLWEGLGLDSLEVAELSAILEDELGSDPYSAGEVPRTTREVIAYYNV